MWTVTPPSPPRPGRLVLLNGVPSSGKTTIARGLRAALSEPFFHLSLDEFRQGYDARFWRDDPQGVLFRRTLDAYLHSVRVLVGLGHDVISEAVIGPVLLPRYLEMFASARVLLVGVRCPFSEVRRREAARTDRVNPGSPPPLDDAVHAHGCYDLDFDTSVTGLDEIVGAIGAALVDPPSPSAFALLRSR